MTSKGRAKYLFNFVKTGMDNSFEKIFISQLSSLQKVDHLKMPNGLGLLCS